MLSFQSCKDTVPSHTPNHWIHFTNFTLPIPYLYASCSDLTHDKHELRAIYCICLRSTLRCKETETAGARSCCTW